MNRYLSRSTLIAAWISTLEGDRLYVGPDPDSPVHTRCECPFLGKDVKELVVQDGRLIDDQGFYYREVLVCSACVKEISRSPESGR
jgi:hypothetical protein